MARAPKKSAVNRSDEYDPYTSRGMSDGKAADLKEETRLNSELTPAEARALHMHHFRLIEAQKGVVKAAQDALKTLRKTAKTDGLVMADLDFMARCATLEDPSIAPAEILRRAEIASWFALPVNFQPDMFTDRMPLDERAYEEGVAAGLQGKDPVAPYDATSSPGQRFLAGWHEGQRQMREELVSAMTKRNAAKASDEIIKGADNGEDPFADEDDQREAAE
jgi:ribosome modulation factor